jgi:hypothetical protein
MPNARPLAAAAAMFAAAAMLVSLPAGAAAKPAPIQPTKVQLVRQISKLDGQFHALRNRVKVCPSARTDLRVAQKQRNAAVRGASVKRTKSSLKARRARMAASVVRLARAAKTCATSVTATGASVAAVPGPTPGTAMVLLPDLLGGVQVNVGSLTDGLPLGTVLQLVDIDGRPGRSAPPRG